MANVTFIREDQAAIHAGVTDVPIPSTVSWASLQGGDVSTTSVKTRPGGMQPEQVLGGPPTRSDVTVKRQYTPEIQAIMTQLEDAVGRKAAWASYTLLDADGNPNGSTITMKGILQSASHSDFDANASNAGFLTLVISLQQSAATS